MRLTVAQYSVWQPLLPDCLLLTIQIAHNSPCGGVRGRGFRLGRGSDVEWGGWVGVHCLCLFGGLQIGPSCIYSNMGSNCISSKGLNFKRLHKWNSGHAETWSTVQWACKMHTHEKQRGSAIYVMQKKKKEKKNLKQSPSTSCVVDASVNSQLLTLRLWLCRAMFLNEAWFETVWTTPVEK